MYSQDEIAFCEQAVRRLAKKATLRNVPTVKVSTREHLAHVNIFTGNRITIGTRLLSCLHDGRIDPDDVEAILAHEIGHLMDFDKGLKSMYLRSWVKVLVYSFVSPFLLLFSLLIGGLALGIMFSVFWLFFLPFMLSRRVNDELEADRNALNLIEARQLATSLVRRIRMISPSSYFGPLEIWRRIRQTMTAPTIHERLRNINVEIEKIDVQFKITE